MSVKFDFRQLTDSEYQKVKDSFEEHGKEYGNALETSERYTFVASDGNDFIGCSSGLVNKNGNKYQNYFFLTDLLIEKEYRHFGYGQKLLKLLEDKISMLGIKYVWTWTAGYEAPDFYQKQGYKVFVTFENWYPLGHSRVGLIKEI